MKQIILTSSILYSLFLASSPSLSQIQPDMTLGNESSQLLQMENSVVIEGGAIRGTNLFHSFEEFNIEGGMAAFFSNPAEVETIFSRVTGENLSNIFGALGVNGSANLFLINPNGIVFGNNAEINVLGSFIATTASSLEFEDGQNFSTEQEKPLLTWSAPIGLSLNENSRGITVQGSGNVLSDDGGTPVSRGSMTGIFLSPSQTFALLSNGVNFEGGVVSSPAGNIEIASIRQGRVGIKKEGFNSDIQAFSFEEVEVYSNINFSNRSLLDVTPLPLFSSDLAAGGIAIRGREILIENGSLLLSQNFSESSPGSVFVSASENLQISGTDRIAGVLGGIRTEGLGNADGADIFIETPSLNVIEAGTITSISFNFSSQNESGDISIFASDLRLSGFSPINPTSVSNIATFTFSEGSAGNLLVDVDSAIISEGAFLGSSGFFGSVGVIELKAEDFIRVEGFQPDTLSSSSISSLSTFGTTPGEVNISTRDIFIEGGGSINTSTIAQGSAGDLEIFADNIFIEGQVNTLENVEFEISSNISSSATPINQIAAQDLLIDTGAFDESLLEFLILSGDSGNINIGTDSLTISDGGTISVQNSGVGNAGSIILESNFLGLNGANINAASLNSNGGNINIESAVIQQNNSDISAFAGNVGGNIELNSDQVILQNNSEVNASALIGGGNIELNTENLLAINSDIIATALQGDGGNIAIDSALVLGLEEREAIANNDLSDVDASSSFGQDGVVVFSNPQNDFSDPIIALKDINFQNQENKHQESCFSKNFNKQDVKVTYVGREGFSESPDRLLDKEPSSAQEDTVAWQPGDPVIQANRVIRKEGKTYFVAQLPLKFLCNYFFK